MPREDWRRRYMVLRGGMGIRATVHRWRPGEPYDSVNTACGLMRREGYGWHLLLDINVAPAVHRCRRCWP